jgi:hypothetical protein
MVGSMLPWNMKLPNHADRKEFEPRSWHKYLFMFRCAVFWKWTCYDWVIDVSYLKTLFSEDGDQVP